MKFDYIIQNPPYNPNSLWKKFVLKCIDLLTDNGKMVAIHPYGWRESSTHSVLCNHLKEHISELHINDYNIWPSVMIKTDWYVYNKTKHQQCKVTYSNGEIEFLNLNKIDKILRLPTTSIPYNIYKKISTTNGNNLIMDKGFNDAYKNNSIDGKYKQCGGPKKGVSWTIGDYLLTNNPTKHQFENKIVMAYAGKPRATFFANTDEVGVCVANYWLTDNIKSNINSIIMLMNSKLFWKLFIYLADNGNEKKIILQKIPAWLLKSINVENCYFTTEKEMYKHFNLTQEEIDFINI